MFTDTDFLDFIDLFSMHLVEKIKERDRKQAWREWTWQAPNAVIRVHIQQEPTTRETVVIPVVRQTAQFGERNTVLETDGPLFTQDEFEEMFFISFKEWWKKTYGDEVR